MKIAIIIPTYNEEITIRDVITEYHNQQKNAEIYIIDNNSTDNSNKIAQETLSKLKCKGAVLFEKKQGKAYAIRKAFNEIDADIYVMLDADLTYKATDLPLLLGPVQKGYADMCIGDRLSEGDYYSENKRLMHNFGNKLVLNLVNVLFRTNLKDIMTGYRVFNKKFVKNFPILSTGFELETEMTLFALDKRFTIIEVPIHYKDRPPDSKSKLNTISDGTKVLKMIFSIFQDYKPFAFYTICSLILLCFGLLTGVPVIIEFILTRYITKVPSAILSTGLIILSVIFFSIGLILHTLVQHFRFLFEHNLNIYSLITKDK